MNPGAVGAYGDDTIYLATGRSLVAGGGWRVAELPLAPQVTKYPPLYAAVCGLASGLPVAAVLALSAAFAGLALHVLVNHILPERGVSPVERALTAALAAVNTVAVLSYPTAMSEALFTLLLMLQLGAGRPAALGLWTALAGLTRTAGLVLDGALFVAARSGRARLAIVLGAGLAVLGAHLQRIGVPTAPAWLDYFADYRLHLAWYAPDAGARAFEVAAANLPAGVAALGEYAMPTRISGIDGSPWPFGLGLLLLALVGLARRLPAAFAVVVANLLLYSLWTWAFSTRFWLPVWPLVAAGAVLGLGELGGVGRALRLPLVLLFVAGNAIRPVNTAIGLGKLLLGVPPTPSPEEAALQARVVWVDGALGPEDVFIGDWTALWMARRVGTPATILPTLLPRDELLRVAMHLPPADPTGLPERLREGLLALRADLGRARVLVVLDPGDPLVSLVEAAGLPTAPAPAGTRAWELP